MYGIRRLVHILVFCTPAFIWIGILPWRCKWHRADWYSSRSRN